VDARIRCDSSGFQSCDVRDINMDGALVLGRDGGLTRLPKNSPVEVVLKLDAGGRVRTHTIRARVDKKTRDGTSLVFTDAALDTYSALLDLSCDESGKSR